jgi:hypothetical protein
MKSTVAALGAALTAMVLLPAAPAAAQPGAHPDQVEVTLNPGSATDVAKSIETESDFPEVDVYFLADTTGSMAAAIDNVQDNAVQIMTSVSATLPGAQFGAGEYRDFPVNTGLNSFAFRNNAPIGSIADAQAAINTWEANEGGDTPEGQLFALQQLIPAANFRPNAAHIVVWFGDAPGHDPICSAISGLPNDITEATATAALQAARVQVVAISTDTGVPGGLNADPTLDAFDYEGICDIGGSPGQATRITAATDGEHFENVDPAAVSQLIIDAVRSLDLVVSAEVDCPQGVDITFDADSKTVERGGTVDFTEHISVPAGTPAGDLHCTVSWLQDGLSPGDAFVQRVTVHVTGAPPTVSPTASPTAGPLPITGGTGPSPGVATMVGGLLAVIGAAVVALARQRRRTLP